MMSEFIDLSALETYLVAFIVVAAIIAYIFNRLFTYKLSEDSIGIKAFGILPVMRIRYSDILEIKTGRRAEHVFSSLAAVNLPSKPFCGTIVIIWKKSGIAQKVYITPDKAEEFVVEVKSKIAKAVAV